MSATKYKWAHPHEWFEAFLQEKLNDPSRTPLEKINYLVFELREVISKLDADQVQDLYKTEMDRMRYFDEENQP